MAKNAGLVSCYPVHLLPQCWHKMAAMAAAPPASWLLTCCMCFNLLAGNATFADVVVIWARNMDTKQVNAFVVKKGTPGFTTTKIENKISLR
jgi:hypothetical protein